MRPRFTIRDLLWLTLVVGLIIGWWLDHRELAKQHLLEFSVYYLKHANANEASKTLQTMLDDNADVGLSVDLRLNCLFVRAPAQQQAAIESLLSALDVSAPPAEQKLP